MTLSRTTLRVILPASVLALAVLLSSSSPAAAKPGPTSWKAVHYEGPGTDTGTSGNPDVFRIQALDLYTEVETAVLTAINRKDEEGHGSKGNVTWIGLEFVGSDENTTDHKWKITTSIHGGGSANAHVPFEGSAYMESIQIVQFDGDNENVALGHLAVMDRGPAKLALGIPPGFRVALDKTQRTQGKDSFDTNEPKSTQGKGKRCRVRVKTWVNAKGAAKSNVGFASSDCFGILAGDIRMSGTCIYKKTRVTDRLVGRQWPSTWGPKVYTPPTGGMEKVIGEIPTDKPSDEEREGKKEELPEVDAKDLVPTDDGGAKEATPETTPGVADTPEKTPEPDGGTTGGDAAESPDKEPAEAPGGHDGGQGK